MRRLVSTLLEILDHCRSTYRRAFTDNQFQPFLRFWHEGSCEDHRPLQGVSTLLEILVASTSCEDIKCLIEFQPFLRFWSGKPSAPFRLAQAGLFQPFLRFWRRGARHSAGGGQLLAVSTLLEILDVSAVYGITPDGMDLVSTLLEILVDEGSCENAVFQP
jgi:hypothetical protein